MDVVSREVLVGFLFKLHFLRNQFEEGCVTLIRTFDVAFNCFMLFISLNLTTLLIYSFLCTVQSTFMFVKKHSIQFLPPQKVLVFSSLIIKIWYVYFSFPIQVPVLPCFLLDYLSIILYSTVSLLYLDFFSFFLKPHHHFIFLSIMIIQSIFCQLFPTIFAVSLDSS